MCVTKSSICVENIYFAAVVRINEISIFVLIITRATVRPVAGNALPVPGRSLAAGLPRTIVLRYIPGLI